MQIGSLLAQHHELQILPPQRSTHSPFTEHVLVIIGTCIVKIIRAPAVGARKEAHRV
jgi:hypothetical protein